MQVHVCPCVHIFMCGYMPHMWIALTKSTDFCAVHAVPRRNATLKSHYPFLQRTLTHTPTCGLQDHAMRVNRIDLSTKRDLTRFGAFVAISILMSVLAASADAKELKDIQVYCNIFPMHRPGGSIWGHVIVVFYSDWITFLITWTSI